MPYLQVNDKQIQLRLGETRIGVGGQVELRLPGSVPSGASPVLAVVELGRESHAAIRRAGPEAVIHVNGVQLGAEPSPLIHGDKIEAAGVELYFGDDRKGGSTQFIPAARAGDLGRLRPPTPARATSATGGRVISLVDGREYSVSTSGLVFGRDAGCDVVIPSSEVSRRHAEIVPGDRGYVVTDTSTNGLFVNGERVEGMQILGRGDILRIGGEEFRFYADAAPLEASALAVGAARPSASAAQGPAAVAASATAVVAPPSPPVDAAISEPPVAPSPLRGAIGVLEVVGSGVLRGQKYPVTAVLTHVGRGEHNDVIIPEESVSDSHAKLQRRDGVWYVTDLGSTNGTYVAGRRIQAEERLSPTADLRLGGVKLTFTAIATEAGTGPRGATRAFSVPPAAELAPTSRPPRDRAERAAPAPRARVPAREEAPEASPDTPEPRFQWAWLLLLVAAVIVLTLIFVKGR